jgi:UTP--glucose-1-phosphate uridylyltransferase
MLPIVDKPTIQYIVEEAIQSGIEDIIIVTGRGKRAIEDHFDKSLELEHDLRSKNKTDLLSLVEDISNLVDIHYIRQKEPKGLGHAIYCARTFIGNEPFGVLLGDDVVCAKTPALKQLIDIYDQVGSSVLGVQEVDRSVVHKYGIVDPCETPINGGGRLYRVRDLVEKPPVEQAPSRIAILGRYIITPEVFDFLGRTQAGAGGEIQLTDALRALAKQQDMYSYIFEGERYDVGDKIGFLRATVEFALRRDDLKNEFAQYLKDIQKDPRFFN